jgi:hypothetical protein
MGQIDERQFGLRWFIFVIVLLLAACEQTSAGDPSAPVLAYLEARVATDVDTMRQLSCADWEAQAVIQSESFDAMNAVLEDVTCSVSGDDGDFTLVQCDGRIITTYNGEQREWDLKTYRVRQEDGEWLMCGEAE